MMKMRSTSSSTSGDVGEVRQRPDAVVRLVVGRDADRGLARAHRLLLGRPLGALEDGVLLVGDDVEPDEAAVAVLVEDEVEARRRRAVHLAGLDALAHARAVRAVDAGSSRGRSVRTVSVTSRTGVQCCQYDAGKALK